MGISAVSTVHAPVGLQSSSSKKSGSSSFEAFFAKSSADLEAQTATAKQVAQTPSAPDLATAVDTADEQAATSELLKLYKMLVLGKLDTSALDNSDTNANAPDGPQRQVLEKLKTVLRRILGIQGADTNDNMEDFSLRELIDSLPASIRQMLNKCFANLDEVLKKDDAYRKSLATSA